MMLPWTLPAPGCAARAGRRRFAFVFLLFCGVAGCGALPKSLSGTYPQHGPIIPDTTLNVSNSLQIPLERIVVWGLYAGAAYLILDPMAPNWEIEQAAFPDSHYHFSLKMKRFYAGGAGESRVVFNQRAKELMRQGGYDGYQIMEYSEGMESSVLGSQRVSQGVIRLTRNEVAEKPRAAGSIDVKVSGSN